MKRTKEYKKIESSIKIEDYSILTDTGFEKINKLHKTIPYKVYLLKLIDGRELKCADNHIVFYLEDFEEVFVKDLSPGNKICVNNDERLSESEILNIEKLEFSENMYDFELDNSSNHRYYTNEILSHNTAIIEGLAIKIANGDVDRRLADKKVIDLNMTSIVSGTKYRGEFEQRMEDIVKEAGENPNIIVFLDEIHTIIGAGGAVGSLDAANIIKPAISRGEMRCIGTTTLDDYKKVIENDNAFERRFQKIYINIPTKEETKKILDSIKDKYEDYHNVIYTEEVLNKCVELTDRYINYRNFPDKAIDVMDEVGSWAKLMNSEIPKDIKILEETVKDIAAKKISASNSQEFEDAARLRDEEKVLRDKIEEEAKKWEEKQKEKKIIITVENVSRIISSHTGIPVEKISDSEMSKLKNMKEFISSKVIGQNEAVDKIVQSIQRSKIGIQDPNKPIASFLFLGTTGVGKTHLAKILAEYLFNTPESFIRIDMSEYMEKVSTNKLIGSAPGYIGYDDKGQLTEKVKNRPYSIVLFDEVEKAHSDVTNILLQLLDEGKLTDSTGYEVNFKNTIIIMTSNIGTKNLVSHNKLGFRDNVDESKDAKDIVMKELEKSFRPELINRIDEKIVFNALSPEDILKIVDIELKSVLERIAKSNYNIKIADSVKKHIAKEGYDKKYGARPIKRVITSLIETFISKSIIDGDIKEGEKITLVINKDKEIKINKKKK